MTEFKIGSNNVYGTIPTELGLLTAATLFSLKAMSLNGSIPSELGYFGEVLGSCLYLNNNFLTSTIPSQLGRLTALTDKMYLNLNSLSNSLPTELGQLTGLVASGSFIVTSNFLTSTIPSQVPSALDT